MSYTVPQFNLVANIWDCQFPADGDPDWTDVPVQKYLRSRMSLDVEPQATDGFWRKYAPPIQLRFPRDHDAFLGIAASWSHVVFEVPAGSGAYFRTRWQEIQHEGFPNEYAIILVTPCTIDGLAIGPPLAEYGLGTESDVCPPPSPPPPPVAELQQANFILRDDASTGMVGVIARRQSESNFYEAAYSAGDGTFYILKRPDSPFPNVLASYSLVDVPAVGDFCAIYFTVTDDELSARIVTLLEDQTITATDSTYATGDGGGLHIEYVHDVTLFEVYHDLDPVAADNFSDTPFTDLSSHTMLMGSGWFYGSTGSVFEITASGSEAGPAGTSAPVLFQIVMTDYASP